jgi:peptidoglycan/LPS O-acetylase OafA/YrhL
LFFIISGFILSLPFAKWRLKGAKEVNLGKYFLRRVTRLEPPYLIALAIYFLAHLFVVRQYELSTLFPHFFASVFYSHTIIYHSFPLVLPVAWSLEVEVQFYILAPLFCLLFLLKNTLARRIIFLVIIIASALYWFDVWKVSHLFM